MVKAIDDANDATGARLDRGGRRLRTDAVGRLHHGRLATERLGAPALVAR